MKFEYLVIDQPLGEDYGHEAGEVERLLDEQGLLGWELVDFTPEMQVYISETAGWKEHGHRPARRYIFKRPLKEE